MCSYYAHAFDCKHVSLSFARFCRSASLIQTACARREVWHTIHMGHSCDECRGWGTASAAAAC